MAKHYFFILLSFYILYVSAKPNVIDDENTSNGDLALAIDNVTIHTDPEVWMNTSQLISSKGYPSEEYDVHTSDGYILGIQRIPYGRYGKQTDTRPVILLHHGLLSCSACWVENLVNQSLGFILADAGYDVWLGNSRGNTYGRRHETLSTDDDEFWNFNFDDMAVYDMPATVDKILAVTGAKQIYYVGHSQGTMIAFAGLSENKDLASKIKLFVALAPAAYLGHLKSPIKVLTTLPDNLLYGLFGKKDFLPRSDLLTWLGKEVCGRKIPGFLCENVLFLLGGYDFQQMNETRIPVYVGQHPAGTSVQNMLHYSQAVKSNEFQKMDLGTEGNIAKYNQSTPPVYNPKNINTPMAIYSGTADWLTVPEDVQRLTNQLGSNLIRNFVVKGWEHLDFIWAMNAVPACYSDMLQVLKEHA